MFRLLKVLWQKLDGYKTLIGLLYFALQPRFLPDIWWADVLSVLFFTWTGVGAGHKIIKYRNGNGSN